MSNGRYESGGIIRDLKLDMPYYTDDIVDLLEEKDKEIEYYKKQAKKFNNETQKYYEDAYCNNFHNQDKISFTVEQLEKVKECLKEEIENVKILLDPIEYEDYHELLGVGRGYKNSIEIIDNQIKEIKGEK